jgi:hypothetical protein
MKRPSSILGVAVAVAVVLALSACAPPVSHAPASSPEGHTHPHARPTPTQAADPTVRVPLTCSSLYSDATVGPLIGTAVVTHIDETTKPTNIVDITARQYGSLICLWGGHDRTDTGYDQNLTIEISPDAVAGFDANIQGLETLDGAPTAENTAGDRSEYYCGVQGETQCSANMLVGSFWVTASFQNLSGTVSQTTANARMQSILKTIAADLAAKSALPAWNPPGAALPGFCSNPASIAQVNTALGVTGFAAVGDDDGLADAESFTQLPQDYSQCTWSSSSETPGAFSFVSIAMLRGGSWVLPHLAGETDSGSYMLGPFSQTSVPGADSAVSSCSASANQCEYLLAMGGVLVNVNLDDPGAAKVTAAMAKLIADIAQS